MKVSSTELPPRQVSLEIEVEQERVDREMDLAFRRLAGRVNVPGFRKGKAPRPLVERMVGHEAIVEDALEHLVPVIVTEAIDQEKVEPFGRPSIDSIEVGPLRVKATVPLAPHIELGPYGEQLRIDREEVDIRPEQVDEVIERLRASFAQWVPVERTVQMGDRISMDVKGEALNPSHPYVDTQDAEFEVKSDGPEPAPGFAEQLIGMAPGEEKVFNLPLAADEPDETLQNREIAFTVKVNWVKEKQLPEVDDAFAQQVGEHADVAALRSAIEQQLHDRETSRIQDARENAALDKLVELSTVEVAPQVIDVQTQRMVENFASTMERQGLKLDQYLQFTGRTEVELRTEMRERAAAQVRRGLALDTFADAEKVTVDPSEVEAEVRAAAARTPEPEATATAALANAETIRRVEDALRERKAMARLVSLALGEDPDRTAPEPPVLAAPADTPEDGQEKMEPSAAATVDTSSQSSASAASAGSAEHQEKV